MEILGIILLVPLSGVTIVALFAALNLLLPEAVAKTRANLEKPLGRSLLLGVVNFTFFAILALVFIWLAEQSGGLGGIFFFLASIIIVGVAVFAVFGLSAFATLLGEGIGGGKTPFASDLRGGTLLLLAILAPYVGWFIFLPLILWTGFGAAISAFRWRKKAAFAEEEN
ncbi:MAG: hypothetical protein HN390_16810 [Anaerolineae bacterium]|jgi:hypothetical protein|nr:hypothetical protein [Anaerolineae bacterium]MBT7191987.1 hypothetical protein [Anaerolineae bacterium]MBT7992167.1 hypothetical protein [Anaerolineae bacterium]